MTNNNPPPLPTQRTIRLTVLISGNGTNLQALIDKIQTDDQFGPTTSTTRTRAKIVRVISNRREAYGLQRARQAQIPVHYHNLVKYKKKMRQSSSSSSSSTTTTEEGVQRAREEYDADLARLVLGDEPDLVVCLGFMHVLSPHFLAPLEAAKVGIVNLHPALPGAFNGVVCFPPPPPRLLLQLLFFLMLTN